MSYRQNIDMDDIMQNVMEGRSKPIDPQVFSLKPPIQANHNNSHTKKIIIAGLIITLTVSSTATIIVAIISRQSEKLPAQHYQAMQEQKIYYPAEYPSGYSLDPSSLTKTEEVTIYTASNKQGDKISFSHQPLPLKSVTDDFNSQKLSSSEKVNAGIGEAYLGIINGRLTASITTSDTWILINCQTGVTANQLKVMVNSIVASS